MKMAATMYECHKCHRKVSAATARKDHYKDPIQRPDTKTRYKDPIQRPDGRRENADLCCPSPRSSDQGLGLRKIANDVIGSTRQSS